MTHRIYTNELSTSTSTSPANDIVVKAGCLFENISDLQ